MLTCFTVNDVLDRRENEDNRYFVKSPPGPVFVA